MDHASAKSAKDLLAQFSQLASDEEFHSCVIEPFGPVKIRSMSLRTQFDLAKIEDKAIRVAKSVALTLCSVDGALVFDATKAAHLSMIADYPRHLLNALLAAQAQANGMGEEAEGAALKNSQPSEGSSSG